MGRNVIPFVEKILKLSFLVDNDFASHLGHNAAARITVEPSLRCLPVERQRQITDTLAKRQRRKLQMKKRRRISLLR